MPEYKFDVVMTCSGCSGAVTRALGKQTEIDSFDVSLETQKVVVRSEKLTQQKVLEIIEKTGKAVKVSE